MTEARAPSGGAPLAIVCDFDGTIVTRDLGDEICRRRAPADRWAEFERDWLGGRLTLAEAQRRLWPLVRVTRDEFFAIVDEVACLRDGAERFLAAARACGAPLVVASSGFRDYIERVLGAVEAGNGLRIYANGLEFDGDRIRPTFPWIERYRCPTCDLCKGAIVDELRAAGHRVAFLGDGRSDRCAAPRADRVFAVAGSSLARWLRERGIEHVAFSSFDEVREALGL